MCAGHITIKGELKSYHLYCELPRKKYMSVSIDGSQQCIMEISDATSLAVEAINEGDFENIVIKKVVMTEIEFENLPEFWGF